MVTQAITLNELEQLRKEAVERYSQAKKLTEEYLLDLNTQQITLLGYFTVDKDGLYHYTIQNSQKDDTVTLTYEQVEALATVGVTMDDSHTYLIFIVRTAAAIARTIYNNTQK